MRYLFVTVLLATAAGGFAQRLSFGVVAGAGLNEDFENKNSGYPIIARSNTKHYLVGGLLEVELPAGFSVEVDGIYRPLGFTEAFVEPNGTLNSVSPATVVTWEFPILMKYRFFGGRAPFRPFLEAGPSLRTAGNLNGASPSGKGITAGVGLETHLHGLTVSPAVRYTRWARDPSGYSSATTRPDQVELVVGFSHRAESNWRLVKGLSAGIVAGASLNADYKSYSQPVIFVIGGQELPGSNNVSPGGKSLVIGPTLEYALYRGLGLEAGFQHRQLRGFESTTLSTGEKLYATEFSTGIWEFPLLAKYRFPALPGAHAIHPLIELGPGFRTRADLAGASNHGIVAGAGIEARLGKLKLAPTVRLTHWGADHVSHTTANQAEALMVCVF